MASGTIQVPPIPNDKTSLYSTSSNVTAINHTFALNDSLENYKFIMLLLYNGTPSAGTRGYLVVPTATLDTPQYWPLACGGTWGWLRLNLSSGTSLITLESSYSTLYCRNIYGLK